jgi:hypothetical protein
MNYETIQVIIFDFGLLKLTIILSLSDIGMFKEHAFFEME